MITVDNLKERGFFQIILFDESKWVLTDGLTRGIAFSGNLKTCVLYNLPAATDDPVFKRPASIIKRLPIPENKQELNFLIKTAFY